MFSRLGQFFVSDLDLRRGAIGCTTFLDHGRCWRFANETLPALDIAPRRRDGGRAKQENGEGVRASGPSKPVCATAGHHLHRPSSQSPTALGRRLCCHLRHRCPVAAVKLVAVSGSSGESLFSDRLPVSVQSSCAVSHLTNGRPRME